MGALKLVIVEGPSRGKEFPLGDGETVLGRTNETEIELPSNKVSRKHAALRVVDGTIEIEDLGSSNGTFLNGKRITRSTVPPGGKIGVGEYLLQVLPIGGKGAQAPGGAPRTGKAVMVVPGGQRRGPGQQGGPRNVQAPSETAQRAADQVVGKIGIFSWRIQIYMLVALMGFGMFIAVTVIIRRGAGDYSNIAMLRAKLLSQQLAALNATYVKNRETTLLSLDSVINEMGVKDSQIVDANGAVLVPPLMRGRVNSDPAVVDALKKHEFPAEVRRHAGSEEGWLEIAAPILYWNRDLGKYDLVGAAYIIYAPNEVANNATPPILLYGIGILGLGLSGAFGILLLFRATERPIAQLQEDTELIIRGDLKGVKATTRMPELEALAHSITRLYQKTPAMGNLGTSSAFAAGGTPGQLALPASAGPVDNTAGAAATVRALVTAIPDAAIVVDADSNVVDVNAAAEKMFGLIPARVRGKHLLEAITDQGVLNQILDLLNEIAAAPSGVVERDLEIPGADGATFSAHVSAAGVRQGKELTGSAIVIRREGGG